ncbi:hypothetical protein Tco_0641141 [Tanacetum coccineum]
MAAPGSSNSIARRVVDELSDFSGEIKIPKYMKFFILQQIAKARHFVNLIRDQVQTTRTCIAHLNAMISKMEAMDDQEEVYGSLMCLRDGKHAKNNKLMALNELIDEAEEDINTKEAHVEIIEAAINSGINEFEAHQLPFAMLPSEFLLARLTKVVDSSRLQDKMKVWFIRARTEDESFVRLMCDLCFGLRMTLSKNQRLITDLEALGEWGDAVRSLEHMREIVAHDFGKLGVLEQLLVGTHVGIRLKDGYVADMEEKE